MENVWLEIIVEGEKLAPVQIIRDGNFSIQDDMNVQSLAIKFKEKTTLLNISIIGYKGENLSSANKFFEKKKHFDRVNNLSYYLSRVIAGNAYTSAKINVFYNIIDSETVCVGFVSQKFESFKVDVKVVDPEIQTKIAQENGDSFISDITAKEIFTSNYINFTPLIPELLTDKLSDEWENVIKLIPNSQNLFKLYISYKYNPKGLLGLVKSWGVKYDMCKLYPKALVDLNKYYISEDELQHNELYGVISPCWTIWIEDNGKRLEKVIAKGILNPL